MTEFQVSTVALRHTATELRDAVAVAHDVHKNVLVLRCLAHAVGDPVGEGGLDHFLGKWSYGMGLIGDDATTLATFLSHTADAYDAVEQHLVDGCR